MTADPSTFADTVELLLNAQQGDTACLDAVVQRYRQRMLDRIRLMMGRSARRAAESADFLQAVIADIVANLHKLELRDERTFLRWAMRIARNNIRDSARKRREERFADLARSTVDGCIVDEREAGPLDVTANQELSERLLEALEKLSPDHQLVIELRDFEGLPFAAIGRQMGRSENAVQTLHTRALIKLGGLLQTRS
jgi:RNA polymerase sigma-70 factor (ECF subfamily)